MGELSELIARNARALRAAQRLRQVEVAAAGGIARSHLSVIEAGGRKVTIEDVQALCAGLGCTLLDLLQGAAVDDLRQLGLSSQGA